jgi:hypothetical protein
MWLFQAWLVLLLLQWALIFVAHGAAAITAAGWSVFVLKTEVRGQKTPTQLDASVLMGLLLATGATLITITSRIGFSLWVAIQIVTFFYFAHQDLPPLQAADVLAFIIWGLYVVLSFMTTFAAYSAVAWLPNVLYTVPTQIAVALGVISIVGSYVQADTYTTEAAAGALLALNFCSLALAQKR